VGGGGVGGGGVRGRTGPLFGCKGGAEGNPDPV